MQRFSLHSFGSSHVQHRTSDRRLSEVGTMGDWLEQSGYGAYVKWEVKHGAQGLERDVLVVEKDGLARIPSTAALMEYVLSMATGDVESRPKGGRPEYRNGPHAKPSILGGKKHGSFMTKKTKKKFGWGCRGDSLNS